MRNSFIEGISLSGNELSRFNIIFDEVLNGDELEFEMSKINLIQQLN